MINAGSRDDAFHRRVEAIRMADVGMNLEPMERASE